MKLSIPTPRDFNFNRTILSHGWCQLLPCQFDQKRWTLLRVFDIGASRPIAATIRDAGRRIEIDVSRKTLGKRASEKIVSDIRHMFRLDDDMRDFYQVMAEDPHFAWIVRTGAGRMLRSPTIFEDLVKTICTTNCSWALTEKMVTGLANNLGLTTVDSLHSFPTPAAMAKAPASFYRDEMRAGYRAAYFKELAERVASGDLDVEVWRHSDLPTEELKREIKGVKGVGDYAAENLLKLIGRYDGLALDSWLRSKFARTHNKGRACSDKKITRHYARFGKWRGLALWCDMTKDWIEEQGEG